MALETADKLTALLKQNAPKFDPGFDVKQALAPVTVGPVPMVPPETAAMAPALGGVMPGPSPTVTPMPSGGDPAFGGVMGTVPGLTTAGINAVPMNRYPTVPTPPVPDYASLEKPVVDAQAKLMQAKTDKQYNPKWYDRLLAAVAAFGIAYGNPNSDLGYRVGSEITNHRRDRAVGLAQQGYDNALVNRNAAVKNAEQTYQNQQGLYRDVMESQRFNRQLDQDERHWTQSQAQIERQNKQLDINQQRENEREQHNRTREEQQDRMVNVAEKRADNDARRIEALIRNSGSSKLSGVEQLKLNAYSKQTGRPVENLTVDEINDALNKPSSAMPTFKDADSITKWSDKWYLERRRQVSLDKERARKLNEGDKAGAQREYASIEDQYKKEAAEHERQKTELYKRIGRTPVTLDSNGAVQQVAAAKTTASQNLNFPLSQFGERKAGDTVKLKNGKTVRITGFNKAGQFSYDEL